MDNLIALKEIEGNATTSLNTTQTWLYPYASEGILLWSAIWLMVLVYMGGKYVFLPLARRLNKIP